MLTDTPVTAPQGIKRFRQNSRDIRTSLCTGNKDRPKPFLTWSLKSGGRFVGFDKRLHLEAFAYLSAHHRCINITERQTFNTRLSDMARNFISIATRNINGDECFHAIQDDDDPDQEGWFRRWRTVKNELNSKSLDCGLIYRSDLSLHQTLIQNWLQMMNQVRTAELNPDFDIQAEIKKYAAHPEGISIHSVLEHINSPKPSYVVAQAYWMLHERELTADISTVPLSNRTVLHRSSRH